MTEKKIETSKEAVPGGNTGKKRKRKHESREKGAKEYRASSTGYYRADDVADILGLSQSRAYKIIAAMRADLIQEGKLPEYYPNGHVPAGEFRKRFMLDE